MGPDGDSQICVGPIGMLYRPFDTEDGSAATRQPYTSSEGYVLTWDGRLDNSCELGHLVRDKKDEESNILEIVIGAYGRFGIDGFSRLIGDFALRSGTHFKSSLCSAVILLGGGHCTITLLPNMWHGPLGANRCWMLWNCHYRSVRTTLQIS